MLNIMKNFKINTYLWGMAIGLLPLAAASCSDTWDDHYDTPASGRGTLWETIGQDASLSHFAAVVKGCGYDRALAGSQNYTVFALTNDGLSQHQADSLVAAYREQKAAGVRDNDNTVVRQFLQNHIALYRHSVSSLTNDSVTMLNGKYEPMTPNAVGGSDFVSTNTACSNGVLYTVGKRISYFPNVLEYMGMDASLDSAYQFINSYSSYTFNVSASVPGDIVDGKTVYLDSVMDMHNDFLQAINASLNAEDSTYTVVVPDNDTWSKLYGTYKSYFAYDRNVTKRDSLQRVMAGEALLGGAAFSMNVNQKAALADSVTSTSFFGSIFSYRPNDDKTYKYYRFYHPYEAGGVFYGAKAVRCSNGQVLKGGPWNIKPEQTFVQEIKVECEIQEYIDTIANAVEPLTNCNVPTDNSFYGSISSHAFAEVKAASGKEGEFPSPMVRYNIPRLLSNVPYDIYVVFAPIRAYDAYASADDMLPSRVRFQLNWYNLDHKKQQRRLKTVVTDPAKADTVTVATKVSFPTTTFGLTDHNVTLSLYSAVNRNQTATYSNDFRIDCIIFRPHRD